MSLDFTVSNMSGFLRCLEERDRERVVFTYMEGAKVCGISGCEFFGLVRRRAFELDCRGLSGRHVGIMGRNRWEWMVSLCAVFQVGGTAVLLSPELNCRELAGMAERTEIACIMCDGELLDLTRDLAVSVISMDSEPGGEALTTFADAAPEDPACILFTSGTTALPKAAVFSHRALLAGICHNVMRIPFEAQLAVLPMHHIAGFASVMNTWYLGRRICLGEDIRYLNRYLRQMKPDYVLTVPAVLQAILRKLKTGQDLGWNLRVIGCGGAAFPVDTLSFLNGLGIRVLQSYGATEAGGIGFDWEMTLSCRNSIGKPCEELEIKIEEGQLYLRSPSVMSGYYGDPEGTAAVLQEGWYATGDLCEQDSEGYLYLRGRSRNVIILSNGENVSPEQIEQTLIGCGLMEEVMVGLWENQITVWIYPKPGVSRGELEDAVARYNSAEARCRQIVNLKILDTPFAKTETGKKIRTSVTEGSQR